MEQITEPTVNPSTRPIGADAPAVPEVLGPSTPQWPTCLVNDHAQAAFQFRAQLWELSAKRLEACPWPLHWYQNRLYRHLLSGYCGLISDLAKDENHEYVSAALIGLGHIRSKNLKIAMTILRDIKFHIVPGESIVYVMKGLFYFVVVASFVTYLAIVLLHSVMKSGVTDQLLNVFLAFIFGLLGSVVSLLNRISQLEQTSARSQAHCIYTGATSPIVGGISAAVIACLVLAKVISFEGADFATNSWLFVVIGFLSGFSERFTGNLLRIAQTRISGPIDEKGGPSKDNAASSRTRGQTA